MQTDLPFQEKEKTARSVMIKYLTIKTPAEHINFVICLTLMLILLSNTNYSSFYIVIKSIIKAIKEGKILKRVARLIIRRLKGKNINIDTELLEIVIE